MSSLVALSLVLLHVLLTDLLNFDMAIFTFAENDLILQYHGVK